MRLLRLFAAFVLPVVLSTSTLICAVCAWTAWAERSRTSRTQHIVAAIGLAFLLASIIVSATVWAQLIR